MSKKIAYIARYGRKWRNKVTGEYLGTKLELSDSERFSNYEQVMADKARSAKEPTNIFYDESEVK